MKYTIDGFGQEAALNMRATITEDGRTKTIKLDCTDLLILRWIVDFYPNMHKTIIDGAEYAWVSYDALLEDMPLLDISKRALFSRFKKMEQLGILTHKTVTSKGTFAFYGFGENYKRLTGRPSKNAAPKPASTPLSRPKPAPPTTDQDPWGDSTGTDTTQFQTPDDEPQPLIAESQSTEQQNKPDTIKEIVDYLNARLGTHYRATTQGTRKLLKARLKEGFTVEEIKTVIDKKCADWLNNPKMAEYLRPETLFGAKFESYLNAKSRPQTTQNNTTRCQNIDPAAAAYLEANAKYITNDKGWF